MAIDDSVRELLAKAKLVRAEAHRTRTLADIAVDYERLASCQATLLDKAAFG